MNRIMEESEPGAMLSIGALSRATAIPATTLRTWERRYGYPAAQRKPSGHRLYPSSTVPRLRLIAAALASGHRAAEVLTATDAALHEMLQSLPEAARPVAAAFPIAASGIDGNDLLDAVRRFDGPLLTRLLSHAWTRLGPLRFCRESIGPLLVEIGARWATGRLDVQHEHFAAERLTDVLRSLRLPYEDRASGPLVVLVTLPGEQHGLGLQMVALLLAVAGYRAALLGTDVPTDQIAQAARTMHARAVGVSISEASNPRSTRPRLTALRADLPRRMTVLAGGSGAPALPPGRGITVMRDLAELDAWARRTA
jgi:methanogenic corrinoid protein MtbC1/DNA-binding transcriptional MerR regulator